MGVYPNVSDCYDLSGSMDRLKKKEIFDYEGSQVSWQDLARSRVLQATKSESHRNEFRKAGDF